MNPTPATLKEICAVMIDTFNHRRAEILLKAPSITEILSTYPRLADFNGATVINFNIHLLLICNYFL